MRNERIFWVSFTFLALTCQYFLLTNLERNQPSLVSAASPPENLADNEQTSHDLMQEFPIFGEDDQIDMEYLFAEPEQKVGQTQENTVVNSNDTPTDDYNRGYTDGYHRATEQMNCPYPSR